MARCKNLFHNPADVSDGREIAKGVNMRVDAQHLFVSLIFMFVDFVNI